MEKKVILDDLEDEPIIADDEIQKTEFDDDVQDIVQKSDIGEALEELNKDIVDSNTRMTSIDMRSNLYPVEITDILALDSLVGFGFLPIRALAITRQKKRLAVSQLGKGRNQIVELVVGDRKLKNEGSGWDKFGKMLGFGKKEE